MSTMNLDGALAAVVRRAVEDGLGELRANVRSLAAKVEQLRRALPPQLIPVQEAAHRLGLSHATIRRMVKRGDLPYRRFGRSVRVDLTALHPMTEVEVAQAAARARER